jgi:hypothetical protein
MDLRRQRSGVRALIAGGLIAFAAPAGAQELACTVSVNIAQLPGTEYQFLSDLQGEIIRYINGRSWTDDVFADRERIDCSLQIVFREAQGLSRFRADLIVQSSRPIYGTTQRTNVLVLSDTDWEFGYNRGQGLIYNPSRYDAFNSVIDYYVMLILGYDYDTFSELGGTGHLERARAIAEQARGAGAEGWFVPGDDYSRGVLVQQLLDTRYEPLRRAYFQYHFHVLDHFTSAHEQSWEQALEVLRAVNELYTEFNARRHATDVFFSTKHQELADLLSDAPQRSEAYELLVEMDASHQSTYDALVN